MAVTEDDIAFVYDLFGSLGGLTHRKMMGGLSIYSDGQIFAILSAEGQVYLKAAGNFAKELAAEGSVKFEMENGRSMNYWTLPDVALDDPQEACAWARRALEALQRTYTTEDLKMITGRCDCGKVAFELPEVRDSVTVCHCSQCRRTSGHLWASTHAAYDSLTFTRDDGLTWYASSDFAKRGFCRHCGSSLFYRMNNEDGVGIAAGCLNMPTGMHIGKHIFIKDKGDYYDRPTDAPLIERF